MAERAAYLLRLDPEIMAALRRWASDDLRSLNSEIEFLLRRALTDAGRLPDDRSGAAASGGAGTPEDRPGA